MALLGTEPRAPVVCKAYNPALSEAYILTPTQILNVFLTLSSVENLIPLLQHNVKVQTVCPAQFPWAERIFLELTPYSADSLHHVISWYFNVLERKKAKQLFDGKWASRFGNQSHTPPCGWSGFFLSITTSSVASN